MGTETPGETMRAVVKSRPGPGAEVLDVPVRSPGPGEVLVRVEATSICGSDVHIWVWDEWASKRISPPLIFGHEFCGKVVATGDKVTRVKVGDRVVAETHIACGKCDMCRTGNAHVCRNLKILGVDTDGAFAEYVVIPEENAVEVEESIPPEVAALQEPLGNAVHSVFVESVAGKRVLVLGAGPIGLMTVAVLKVAGAREVFVSEPSGYRRKLAEAFEPDHLVDPTKEDLVDYVMAKTGGLGVDGVIEMSGSPEAVNQGLEAVKPTGFVSLLGIPPGEVAIRDFAEKVVFKNLRIYGIVGRRMFETWEMMRGLLPKLKPWLEKLITHRFRGLEKIGEAMELLKAKKAGKIVIIP